MDNEQSESHKSSPLKDKMKFKEKLSFEQFKSTVCEWARALEENRDFEFQIRGRSCRVTIDEMRKSTPVFEYELKNGEYELEMEVKWKVPERESTNFQ